MYVNILGEYSDVIVGHFTGHTNGTSTFRTKFMELAKIEPTEYQAYNVSFPIFSCQMI